MYVCTYLYLIKKKILQVIKIQNYRVVPGSFAENADKYQGTVLRVYTRTRVLLASTSTSTSYV